MAPVASTFNCQIWTVEGAAAGLRAAASAAADRADRKVPPTEMRLGILPTFDALIYSTAF